MMRSSLRICVSACIIALASMIFSKPGFAVFQAPINEAEVQVDPGLPFRDKVAAHQKIAAKVYDAANATEKEIEDAKKANDLSRWQVAMTEYERLSKYAAPYTVAQQQAIALKNDGYVLANWQGQVCKGGACSDVDPMTALFMIALGALVDELNKDKPFGPNNDLMKFLAQPAGGESGEFVKIRSIFIPQHDQGEIAKLLRDPIRRPVEIVQNWRDAVIPPEDNGEIAKIIRDPIKCTVGKIFGEC